MELALFDFDGTITHEDTYVPFLRYATSTSRWLLGTIVLLPALCAHRVGALSGARIRSLVSRVALFGRAADELNALGRAFAVQHIPGQVREEARARLEWHRSQGHRIIVVSASLDLYLRHWCENEGFELICTQVEQVDGKVTGRYLHGDCSGHEKPRRIRELFELSDFSKIYAYGDTKEDLPMLALAQRRYYRFVEQQL